MTSGKPTMLAHVPIAPSPLTVADCLRIPPLAAATVVAGGEGLGRTVRWVHVVDVPDVEECLVGGELVLTSGISLGHDVSLQRRIVPVMEAMGLAGLVVAIGPYVDRVPAVITQAAGKRGMPVMALPWEVNFRDVTEAVMTAIIDRQHVMLERSGEIHRALTRLVLAGGGVADLAVRLAALLDRPVFVLDPAFSPIAGSATGAAGRPPTDELRRLRPEVGDGPPKTVVGSTVDGLLAPVVVERRVHGHLWIERGGRPFGDIDVAAAEHGATVAALLAYTDSAVRRAERRQERDLLDLLLDGAVPPGQRDAVARLFPLGGALAVLVVGPLDLDPDQAEQRAERPLRGLVVGARARWRAGTVALVLPGFPAPPVEAAAERLLDAFADAGARIGVGEPVGDLTSHPDGLAVAYRDARDALQLVPLVDPERRICRAGEARMLRLFARQAANGAPDASLAIDKLADHDAANGSHLLDTLDAFLRHEGNASTTARALGVHRHTLLNRIGRISAVLGADLTPAVRLDLRLQFLLRRSRSAVR